VRTLVCCVDRANDVGRLTGREPPVAGRDDVTDLVTAVGVADPEDTSVNCLLEGLRVAEDLEAEGDDPIVAVVAGDDDEPGGRDRALARQVDLLIDEYAPDSTIVVTDSAADERAVPVIESRLPVDAVDRLVVRQARDIESTYYLLKQFLADEELRATVLVPMGVTLVAFPIIQVLAGTTVAVAAISLVIGAFLLYKGLGVDEYVEDLPAQARDAMYSGQVSIVTYVVALGLALVGVTVGALDASTGASVSIVTAAMEFVFNAVPWLTTGALVASGGRLLDDRIRRESVRTSSVNLPFVAVAVGLVVRGFAGYFLETAGQLDGLTIAASSIGAISIAGFDVAGGTRLALYILAGILVSLLGVRAASVVEDPSFDAEAGFEP
jgi:putative membrane protein